MKTPRGDRSLKGSARGTVKETGASSTVTVLGQETGPSHNAKVHGRMNAQNLTDTPGYPKGQQTGTATGIWKPEGKCCAPLKGQVTAPDKKNRTSWVEHPPPIMRATKSRIRKIKLKFSAPRQLRQRPLHTRALPLKLNRFN